MQGQGGPGRRISGGTIDSSRSTPQQAGGASVLGRTERRGEGKAGRWDEGQEEGQEEGREVGERGGHGGGTCVGVIPRQAESSVGVAFVGHLIWQASGFHRSGIETDALVVKHAWAFAFAGIS